jgi:hypothetical protein
MGDGRGMDDDETAAPSEERFEGSPLSRLNVAGIRGVKYEDIGGGELGSGRKIIAPGGGDSASGEQAGPLGEKARVVMSAGTVGFWSRANEDAQRSFGGS